MLQLDRGPSIVVAVVSFLGLAAGLRSAYRTWAGGDRSLIDQLDARPTRPAAATGAGKAAVGVCVRNGNGRSVLIEELAYTLHSRWRMPPVLVDGELYANLAPGGEWTAQHTIEPTEAAPAGAVGLYHAWCTIERVVVVDGAGRRWRTHPARHGRARRLRWFHRWTLPWPAEPAEPGQGKGQVVERWASNDPRPS